MFMKLNPWDIRISAVPYLSERFLFDNRDGATLMWEAGGLILRADWINGENSRVRQKIRAAILNSIGQVSG